MRICSLILFMLVSSLCFGQKSERLQQLMKQLTDDSIHKLDSFDKYTDEALSLATEQGDVHSQTRLLRLQGVKRYLTGQHDKALPLYLRAMKIAESVPPFKEYIILLYDCAGLYSKNGELAKAESLIEQGIKVASTINNVEARADGFNRLGVMKEKKGNMDSAIICYDTALKLNLSINNLLSASYSLEYLGSAYGQLSEPKRSLEFMRKSLELRRRLNDQFAMSMSYINLAETFSLLGEQDSAIYYGHKAIETGRSIAFLDMVKHTYQFLSGIYEKRGQHQLALDYFKQYSRLHDSIFDNTKSKQLAELTTKYETEKKEEQIKVQKLELERKNIYLTIAILLLVIALIVSFAVYKHRKAKEEARLQKRLFEHQQQAARAVLEAEERERRRIASDLHDGVGQTLSAALMSLNNVSDSLNDPESKLKAQRALELVKESYGEMRTISHQMMPNALLKAGLGTAVKEFLNKVDRESLRVSLETSGLNERMEEQKETILYRVIQETVANVIKHAQASNLYVQIIQDNEGVSVTVEDNGKGFDAGSENEGIGIKNIRNRVQLLKGTVDFESRPGKGTLVSIFIPAD